jgi:hypothetical protein
MRAGQLLAPGKSFGRVQSPIRSEGRWVPGVNFCAQSREGEIRRAEYSPPFFQA